MKKLLSFVLALFFTVGVVGAGFAQQAVPEEQTAVGTEQAAPKKTKKAKHKKSKKNKKSKKAATPAVQ